ARLREAFRWEQYRTVTKSATVSLNNNVYSVDPALVGRKVALVFDPFDLTMMEVRFNGKPMGLAVPHTLTRHAHPKATPETPEAERAARTGIDYLRLLDTTRTAELGKQINYTALFTAAPSSESTPAPLDPTHQAREA